MGAPYFDVTTFESVWVLTQGSYWETQVSNIDIGISMKVEEGLHSMSMKVLSDIKVKSRHCFSF